MSRHLKRLEALRGIETLEGNNISEEGSSKTAKHPEVEDNFESSRRPNLFSFLNDEETYAESEELVNSDLEAKTNEEKVSHSQKKTTKDNKKIKKKSRAKKAQVLKDPPVIEEELEAEIDPIDAFAQHLDNLAISSDKNTSTKKDDFFSWFKIEKKFLNYESELRKLFGASTIASSSQFGNLLQNRLRDPRIQAIERKTKGYFMCQPLNPVWLTLPSSDLSMVISHSIRANFTPKESSMPNFTFQHGPLYIQAQFDFLDASRSHDPSFFSEILQRMPLHVDTLLSMAEFLIYQGNYAQATELVGRALFTLEKAFHASFRLLDCGLDYKDYENRSLFLALFKYIDLIGRKGCWKCAFEYCKLALSLSQGRHLQFEDRDPLGIILLIDFFAIKAEDYNFLLSSSYKSFCSLEGTPLLLPNFYYSNALAKFHMKESSEVASLYLYEAFLNYPFVLKLLAEDKNILPFFDDEEKLYHDYFDSVDCSSNPTILLIQRIYVERAFHLWKEPKVTIWLKEALVGFLTQASPPKHYAPISLNPLDHLYVFRHLLLSSKYLQ